jgi:hypothetical protein
MQILKESEDKLYTNFIYSIKTEVTRQNYLKLLKYYMKFLGVKTFRELIKDKPQKIIESDIKAYLVYLRNQKKISYNSANLYLYPIRKFYYVNTDYQFKWDLINMYLGNDDTDDDNGNGNDNNNSIGSIDHNLSPEEEHKKKEEDKIVEEDRPYSREEIKTMFDAAQEIRVKIVISLLTSSGLRYGAIHILKLRDLEKIEKYNLYKITAYRNSKKYNYKTFCTPECASLIDSYLDYRKHSGEQLNGNSPLLREQFNTTDKLKINHARHLSSRTIRYMINDVLTKYSSLRKKLPFDYENRRKEGKNPTMLTHAFRKFFDTESRKAGVYPDFVELLMGHKLQGVRSHYFKPDVQTLLEGTKEVKGYVAAIDSLTINDENRLSKQVEKLKQQDDYNKYIIDKKIQDLTSKLNEYEEIQKEGRIISRTQAKQFADIHEKVQVLFAKYKDERKSNRDFETETDLVVKDQKFDKMLSATTERIRKRGDLERHLFQQEQNK